MAFIAELKRRQVFRAAIAYLALAWLLIEVAGTLFPGFGVPDWAFRFVVIVLAMGFLPVLVFSWVYEITSQGIKREKDVVRDEVMTLRSTRRLDLLTICLVAVALVFIVIDRSWLRSNNATTPEAAAPINLHPGQTSGTVGVSDSSIAVLPFANRSAKPEDAFFVDGIHDDLLTYISQIGSIKTISRTSVMKYRDSTLSIPEIARELAVATVLEGGVQRAGDQVRINVQLIDARTDAHLWSQIYDRQLTASNIFTIQSEIAGSIAEALRAELTPEVSERIASIPTENLEALEAYFLGRQKMATRRVVELGEAVEHFEQAVGQDSEFALAWAGLAEASILYQNYANLPRKNWFERSQAAAERALQLDPGLAEAHTADGKRRDFQGDYDGAEAAFKRAIQLNTNYAPAYQWYGHMLGCRMNHPENAREYSRKAVELDPRSAIIRSDYSDVLRCGGHIDEAVAQLRRIVEFEPDFAKAYRRLGFIFNTQLGQLDEALRMYRKAFSVDSRNFIVAQNIGLIYVELGAPERAVAWRDRAASLLQDPFVADLAVALPLYLGEHEEALDHAIKDLNSTPNSFRSLQLFRDHAIRGGNPAEALRRFQLAYPRLSSSEESNVSRGNWYAAVDLAHLLVLTGEHELANHLLDQCLEFAASEVNPLANEKPLMEARIYTVRGDWPRALDALEKAVDQGWRKYTWYYFEHDTVFEPIRDKPEFQALVNQVNSDLAAQLTRVRDMEASGEFPPIP